VDKKAATSTSGGNMIDKATSATIMALDKYLLQFLSVIGA
jgi:hypothetical protein